MDITFAPRGILQIDDARLIYRNFEGRGDKFNREGDRNFSIIIPSIEMAEKLIDLGWNVKIKDRGEDEEPFIHLPVKVKINERGPVVHLQSGRKRVELDEESIGLLDSIEIEKADLDIRPYDWTVQAGTPNEKSGRTAYLQGAHIFQKVDRFAARFAEEEFPEE